MLPNTKINLYRYLRRKPALMTWLSTVKAEVGRLVLSGGVEGDDTNAASPSLNADRRTGDGLGHRCGVDH